MTAPRTTPARLLAAATAVAALVALAAGTRGDGPSPLARAAESGAESCRRCHTRAYDAWAGSAHAKTVRPMDAAQLPPDALAGAVKHEPGESTFHRDGAASVTVSLATVGPDGKPLTVPVESVVGFRRIEMFVGRMADGRRQVLPPMRDAVTNHWFDYTHLLFASPSADPAADSNAVPVVAPGEPSFWTGPMRSFDAKCVRCHMSGAQRVEPASDGRGPRTTWRALGVDCEECHGPGEEHSRFWAALPTNVNDPSKDPIRRHARERRFARADAIDLCLRCHLEGEVALAAPGPIAKPLEDLVPTLLDDVVRVDATGRPLELVYDGLPFLASACAERGGLTCATCHDAHGTANPSLLKVPADGIAVCASCHRDAVAQGAKHSRHKASGAGGTCVACHMPLLTIERGHGAVRDHTIGVPRVREGDAPRAQRTVVDACTWCHGGGRGAPAGVPRLERTRLLAASSSWWPGLSKRVSWSDVFETARADDIAAVPGLVEILGKLHPRVVRASAARLLARFPADALEPLAALSSDQDPLVRGAAAGALGSTHGERADAALLAAMGDPVFAVRREAARAALDGWERVQQSPALLAAALPILGADALAVPDDPDRWFRLGSARQIAGDDAGALEAFERQCALDPLATAVREHVAALRKRVEEKHN